MIWQILILGVLPGAVAFRLYPRLTSRPKAGVVALGMAALLAALLAATVDFWWLGERTALNVAISGLIVSVLLGLLAGGMLVASFVGLFGGEDEMTPRPLNRVIATAVTGVTSLLLCRWLIGVQAGVNG